MSESEKFQEKRCKTVRKRMRNHERDLDILRDRKKKVCE
jgi:hypothetical protein